MSTTVLEQVSPDVTELRLPERGPGFGEVLAGDEYALGGQEQRTLGGLEVGAQVAELGDGGAHGSPRGMSTPCARSSLPIACKPWSTMQSW